MKVMSICGLMKFTEMKMSILTENEYKLRLQPKPYSRLCCILRPLVLQWKLAVNHKWPYKRRLQMMVIKHQ